jgi:hypothetical protein
LNHGRLFGSRIVDIKMKGDPMEKSAIHIRLMTADDFDAVVGIDAKVLKAPRP